MEESVILGGIAAMSGVVGIVCMIIAMLAFHIGTSYGIFLLAKKYAPTLHPALAWIPVVNIFVYAKLSGKSLWWLVGLFVPALNLFVTCYYAYWISKRTGRDVGTMLLLVFFPFITLPWLGLRAHNRKTTAAWVWAIIAIVAFFVGLIGIIIGIGSAGASAATNPEIRAQVMEELKDNPEFQKAMNELKNNPEAMKALEEQMKKNPGLRDAYERTMKNNADIQMQMDAEAAADMTLGTDTGTQTDTNN